MRDRRDPWKWPVSLGLTVGLLWAAVFLVPRSWLDFLLPQPAETNALQLKQPLPTLVLLPPLVIEEVNPPVKPEVVPVRKPLPEPTDPRWWTEGWAVRTVQDTTLFAAPNPAASDTVALVWQALGVGEDLLTRVQPDSLLAARLFMLQVADGFRYDELKPYLTGLARSRAYADILARAADMYGEHLDQKIQVPK